jgi:large subunit ribosomal protein L18e
MTEKTKKAPLAKKIAGSRMKAEVNVGKIGRLTKKGETIVVPGKVLGTGTISHAVTVAAKAFSKSAAKKIKDAGGKTIPIADLKEYKNVRLMA